MLNRIAGLKDWWREKGRKKKGRAPGRQKIKGRKNVRRPGILWARVSA